MATTNSVATEQILSEEDWERRHQLVENVIERLTFRPGATISLWGVSITVTETTPCAITGEPTEMMWDDNEAGETLFAHISDPGVTDDDLERLACRAAIQACVNNDLHELSEWFRVDNNIVFDPHPNGGRYEDAPFDTLLRIDGEADPRAAHADTEAGRPGARYPRPDGDLIEIPAALARRVATELCERVTIGGPTGGRFEVWGDNLTHVGNYPDRVTGEMREWNWSRETLAEYVVVDAGNPAAALRSALVTDMFILAAESAVHEAAEWLQLDGTRVWDPHPRHCAQRDIVALTVTAHAAPWVPVHAPAATQPVDTRPVIGQR